MSTSMASVSKFFESLMRFPVAPDPCGFDDGMDEPEDPSDYLQNDSITNDELRGGLSTLRAEQAASGLTLGKISMYTHGQHAFAPPSQGVWVCKVPTGPQVAGLQNDRSIGNSERPHSRCSSSTFDGADVGGMISPTSGSTGHVETFCPTSSATTGRSLSMRRRSTSHPLAD